MFRANQGFRVCTGAHYIGGYISDDESKLDWLRERTLTWERKSTGSAKPRGDISMIVTPQWYVQSNHNGYSFNVSPGTQENRSRISKVLTSP